MEYMSDGTGITSLLVYPNNLYFGLFLIFSIIVIGTISRKATLTIWLQSVPAAICSIGLLLFVTLLMGLTVQNDSAVPETIRKLGLSHILSSWIYLFSSLFLIVSLGLTIVKNIITYKSDKAGFILSHVGLWIVLFGANFGSIQLTRTTVELSEGQITNKAYNQTDNAYIDLPFAIRLDDFILEEYTPKLTLVDNFTGTIADNIDNKTIIADSGNTMKIGDWSVYIEDYIHSSAKAGDRYYFINEPGSAPSAKVMAINNLSDTVMGWVSCGSFNRQYEALKLSKGYSLVMLLPEPKEFISKLTIVEPDGKPETIILEVNKPYSLKGWKIYQMGYDKELGRWSDSSVLELINDPWIWFVYIGIFLMLTGAIYMFWMGSGTKSPVSGTLKKS